MNFFIFFTFFKIHKITKNGQKKGRFLIKIKQGNFYYFSTLFFEIFRFSKNPKNRSKIVENRVPGSILTPLFFAKSLFRNRFQVHKRA